MTPVLEVSGLSQDFGGLRALSDLDLHVNANEIVALIGPNGAGDLQAALRAVSLSLIHI